MAAPTYNARVLVLRKTKLKESDLILTLLKQDGSQIRAVAKGARKPTSSFSSRLELFCVADLLLAHGRTLDIVKEARLISGFSQLRSSVEKTACAAPMTELLERVSDQGLKYEKLFNMSEAALCALHRSDVEHAPAICAAHLLKTFAFTGFLPTFSSCCMCSAPIQEHSDVFFSLENGGVECSSCATPDSIQVEIPYLKWSDALLHATFADISTWEIDQNGVFGALRLCQMWSRFHVGAKMKSLDFLFSCGLF